MPDAPCPTCGFTPCACILRLWTDRLDALRAFVTASALEPDRVSEKWIEFEATDCLFGRRWIGFLQHCRMPAGAHRFVCGTPERASTFSDMQRLDAVVIRIEAGRSPG